MARKKRYIVGITGEKGKGKTSFVHVLVYLLSIHGHAATVLNFADYIKEIAHVCFGRDIGRIHGKLSKEDRELLCKIGDALRGIDTYCLVHVVERKINQASGFVIVGDVRLQSEAELIKKHHGIIVRMESNVSRRHEDYLTEHRTEKELLQIQPDFHVINEGTFADLIKEGKKILQHFLPHTQWKD